MQHNENENVFWGKINSVNKVKAQTIRIVDFIELEGSQRSSQAVVVHLEKIPGTEPRPTY